jgi:hypothetical protein
MSLFDIQDILFDDIPEAINANTAKTAQVKPDAQVNKSNLNNSYLSDKKELNHTLQQKQTPFQEFSKTSYCTIS